MYRVTVEPDPSLNQVRITKYIGTDSYGDILWYSRYLPKLRWWLLCHRHLRVDICWMPPHTFSIWPWLGTPKSMFVRYICKRCVSLIPTNEESAWAKWGKNLFRKEIVSKLSACDVTPIVSLDTNNLSVRVWWKWRKIKFLFLTVYLLWLLVI